MRSWLVTALCAGVACSTWFATVDAAACASICYTTELTGFGPGGSAGCSCSGSGATRTGANSCSCGQCYTNTGGVIIGYAINSDGTCTYGTDCGDCEYSSDASGSSTSTPSTTTPSTTAPTPTTSAPASTTATPATSSPAASSSGSSNATAAPSASSDSGTGSSSTTSSTSSSGSIEGNNAGSTAGSSSSSGGLKTWQVALIICCGVLIFTVAVVSVLSCYCKARNRLYENEDDQADATYYEQQYPRQRQDVLGTGGMATPTLFSQMPTSTRASSRSGSLSNEMKPMYAGSAHGSSDRLVGLAPVHMRNSSGDLAGMAGTYSNERITSGSYPNERIMSGNYPMDRRPSGSNRSVGRRPSVEQTYTARERDSLAVEL